MRVTVCFGQTRVIVPCKGGATVAELVKEACARYKKATGKGPKYWVRIKQLENAVDGGILDGDDYVYDVAEDRDQLIAIFEEEEEQANRYNGWDHMSGGSGSDGHRSPQSFTHHHQGINIQFSDEKSPGNRRHTNAPTGNATVIKHNKRDSDLEVNVGAEALKSGSKSNITVRDPMVIRNEDGPKSPVKKVISSLHYLEKRESESGQNQDHLIINSNHSIRKDMNNLPEQNVSVVSSSSDANTSLDSGHRTNRNDGNFVRGTTRQSTMGLLPGTNHFSYNQARPPPDGRKQNSFDLDDPSAWNKTQYCADQYLPPPPEDPTIYPRFYKLSQEMFVDIDNRHLGIKVKSYREQNVFLGLLVESVDKGGRSEREGLLQQGDIIVEINNYILAQYNLTISQEIFKDAMKFSELQIRVYFVEERERASSENADTDMPQSRHRHTPSIPVLSVVEPTPPKESKISAAKSLPDLNASYHAKAAQDASPTGKLPLIARMSLDTLSNNTRKIGNMFEIELKKGEQGLGFSITTRDTPVGDPGPIYIKNILPKGAAIQDGRLHAGDRLLKVDDVELTGQTQDSAVNILRCIEVGSIVKLVVSRHMNTLPRKMKDDPVTDKVLGDDSNREYFEYEIALNDTGSAGLGISLKGNQSKKTKRDLGIFVKAVFRGGAAYQDGRLQPNDQLVLVNGQSLVGMTNHEAIDTLRTSMSTVGNVRGMIQMVISRRKPRAVEDSMLPQFSSEASSEVSDSLVNEENSRTSFEITGNSKEENSVYGSLQHSEEIPQQIDPNPHNDVHDIPTVNHNGNGGEWTPSPDLQDPEVDPFSRESIFRQSISEKRKGAASRDAQSTDTFKALKSKQLNLEIVNKKPVPLEAMHHSTPAASTSLKWMKPASTNHSAKSPPSARRSPGVAKRNLNNSSNFSARDVARSNIESEVEVGPTLGIAKSSSLESLQTAVENYVDSTDGPFSKPQPRVLRGRVLNESFRAALDQSYDLENLSGRPMGTLREEGERNGLAVSPLAKSGDGRQSRTHEKKRAGKSYKIFGIFRVGKNKRSLSSDRNFDSNSSPHLPESEIHKKLLEAKREDDFKKLQAETERIQAKARAMREQQEQKKKDEVRYKSRDDLDDSADRLRAPSVPVTAMQRMNPDPKVSYSESPSGRRSVDPTAMRNQPPQTFRWHTSKRPTSPIDYSEQSRRVRNQPEKKASVNKAKLNPDYNSLPRQSRLGLDTDRVQNGADGTVTSESGRTAGPPVPSSHRAGTPSSSHASKRQTDNGFNNYQFYNMQKPPGSKRHSASTKPQDSAVSQSQERSEKPKAGRTLYYDDVGDLVSTPPNRSKTPQPRSRAGVSAKPKIRPASTIPYDVPGGSDEDQTFYREDSPEPPTAVHGNQQHILTPVTTVHRHSVHVDTPASRKTERHPATARSRSQKNPDAPSLKWKARSQRHNRDQTDSDSSSPASLSAAERNRDAFKKILNQNRHSGRHGSESIVISPPYNL